VAVFSGLIALLQLPTEILLAAGGSDVTKTLRKRAAGLIVAGVWGWVRTPAAAQDTAIRTMRVLVLNPAGAPPTVLAGAEAAARPRVSPGRN
jgi:hypothetical protein